MGKISRFHDKSNLPIIVITITLIALLVSSSISITLLETYLEAEAKPVGTTSLQSKIDEARTNVQDIAKKLREVKGEKVPNQYIVVLKDNNLLSSGMIRSLAGEAVNQGAALRHIYDHALGGFAIKVPNEKALEAILKIPEVDYVESDIKVKAFIQSLPTGINRVDADLSSTKSGDGSGVVNADISILDTGIDLSHPDLNVYSQVTFVSGTSSGNDDNGHGTAVAGIAAAKDNSDGVVGIAPGARLWSIKVLDSSGNGFISDIIEGVDYVTQHANEIDVANLSFGGDGSNLALRTAIINSVAAGVTYAAAAGNDAKDASSVLPASYPEVIAVSAIVDTDGKCGGISSGTTAGNDDTLADFSNFGSVVDIAAPGVLIKSTARGSSYTNSFSGTSASTPHITGAAALYKSENPGASPSDIRNALRNLGSSPSTICDGNGHGYFTGDPDSNAEPLLYIDSSSVVTGSYHYSPSLVLTGSNYQDTLSSSSLQLSQFSVAAWFKTSSNFGSNAFIVNKGGIGSESSGQNMNYGIWMTSSEKIQAGFEAVGGADHFVTSANTYNDGQWHYAVVTYGASTVILYIDGVQVGTKSTSGASPETSGTKPVRTGANSRTTPPGNFFTGDVDEVRVWNDDLTAQQAADAFAGSISTSGQVLYHPFGSNSPPVANNQVVNVNKNTQQPITLTATDPNNDPLTYNVVTPPENGTLSGTAPNLTYNPNLNHVGSDSFTFKANDGTADSNIATVSITIQEPPVANNQVVNVNKNTQQPITLTATDPNNDPLTYNVVTPPENGTLSGTAPNLTYNPNLNHVGSDSFTFKANDGTADSNIATVDITVQNGQPVANNQVVNVNKNTQQPITLTATDPNNDPLTYSVVAQPLHGTLSPSTPGGPARTYTPVADYVGPDSFTFKANDGTVDSNIATVGVTVQDPGQQGGYNYAPSFVTTGSSFNDSPDVASLRLNQFTVAAWFKTSTNYASDAFIVNKGGVGSDSAGQNLNYGVWMNSAEQIKAGFETSSGADQYVTSVNSYNDNQWHYAVVTNNGANVILYIDGVQVATKATSAASPESTGTKPVRVGANSRVTPPGNFFTGEVDEVRVWNDDLTSQQISSAFAGSDFTAGKQVLHLPFGGGGGSGYNYTPGLVLTGSNFNDEPDSASLRLTQFSVAAWFKTSTNFGSDAFIVNKGGVGSDSTGQNLNYGIWMTSTEQIKAGFETSNGADQYVTSANTYNDGQWHYAVVTYGGSSIILYVDGVQVATKSTLGASPESSGTKPVRIGANSRVTPPGNFFTGEVDEVRVWNDDLTVQQVTSAFAGTSFNTVEQVLYLGFSSSALAGGYKYDPSLSLSGPG